MNALHQNVIGYYQLYEPDNGTCTIGKSTQVTIVGVPEGNGGYHDFGNCTANITAVKGYSLGYASCDASNTVTPLPTSEAFVCLGSDHQWHQKSVANNYVDSEVADNCTLDTQVADAPDDQTLRAYCESKGFNRVSLLSSTAI